VVSNYKVGIIGMGVIGNAVYHSFSSVIPDLVMYDPEKIPTSTLDVMYDRDFIFLCLPNQTVLEEVISLVVNESGRDDINFIIKTTVPIGFTEHIQTIYGNNFCFNPEFLTDRTAVNDFMNQERIILGGEFVDSIEELYRCRFPYVPIQITTSKTAEFVKLMINLYFTTKISFMNEMRDMTEVGGLDWNETVKLFSGDSRISNSHLEVPGPDGKRGFGGKCFPDNLEMMIEWLSEKGCKSEMLEGVKNTNNKYR